MRYFFLFVFILLAVCEVQARGLSKDDFAYGFELKLDGDGAIYKVILPKEVYSSIAFSDLVDLRVFNGANELVPHSLHMREQDESETPPSKDLPLFPLFKKKGKESSATINMRIDQKGDGTIINLTTAEGLKKG